MTLLERQALKDQERKEKLAESGGQEKKTVGGLRAPSRLKSGVMSAEE